jgi:hypothetical protein
VPGVVHLRVVVAHRAGEPLRRQRRGQAERAAGGQVPVMRHRPPGALHRVVQRQARSDVGPLDHLPVQRVQERDRLDQVRGELGDQVTLAQRLVDQLEVTLLQVPQAAVDQLAGPARGAGGQVAGLHQGHSQAAGRGIQRGSRSGDAAPDDQHVEPFGRQAAEHRAALASVQDAVTPHRQLPHEMD